MKKILKRHLKNNKILFNIIVAALCIYLKFAYFTSKWHFIMPEGIDQKKLDNENGLFFAIWHNRLAYSLHIFGNYKNVFGLASPHSDGKIIGSLILMMGHKIIQGSTNKSSTFAVREIITQITNGGKIVVTPDGPRGPVYKNGSIITKIANKYNKKIIPASCYASKYFKLNSWDKMMLPKPFGKILVIIGKPLILSGNDESDQLLLENTLNDLNREAKHRLGSI